MKKSIIAVLLTFLILLLCSFSYQNSIVTQNGSQLGKKLIKDDAVAYSITFVAYDRNSKLTIDGVKMIIIDKNENVIDILTTDKNGKAEKKITTSLDKKYYMRDSFEPVKRGTVKVIAYKEGYCEEVLVEVPVSAAGAYQPFSMHPVVSGQRNEPEVYIANNHHLEIGSLVDKYRQYLNGK